MRVRHLLAVAVLGCTSLGASAVSVFDFANLKYSGGVSSGFLPTDGVYCTGGDLCSSSVDTNVLGDDLTFVSGGVTVHATGFYNTTQVAVVQDHENKYDPARKIGAGLGVYHHWKDTADDNITSFESLVLNFDRAVVINAIGLASEGHSAGGWVPGATFLLNGVNMALPAGSGSISPGFLASGTTFSFAFGGAVPDQFYLSSITVTPVPEPETWALMALGLGLLGVARRRKA
ncbi:PEP-CTERM sorting domain-containing protein [Piscinibacter terrae]|nr:PEP-CTERM sorting domain-containing protein [Albitalea terrae]